MNIDTFEQRFQNGLDAMSAMPLAAARQHYDGLCSAFAPARPEGMEILDAIIDGVAVRHYRPARSRPGAVAYVHGGGFSLGSLDSHQGVAMGLADALEREVLSVGYRLLPEARYTHALDDCRRVFDAIGPVALVGDSAGGRLVLDVMHCQAKVPPLGLIYPLVGIPTASNLGPDAPLLSREDVMTAWSLIERDAPSGDGLRPPAAYIEVLAVSRDPLTASLERVISAWRQGGADVGYHLAENMLHGSLHARESLPQMTAAWRHFCLALKAHLG